MKTQKITQVKKREGLVVEFDAERICNAIKKAFYSQGYRNDKTSKLLTSEVVSQINQKFNNENLPGIESIQDAVEEILMCNGFTDVARAYIVYREKHKAMRASKVVKTISRRELKVLGDDGMNFFFDKDILLDRFRLIARGLKHVGVEEVINLVCKGLYDGVHKNEIDHLCMKEVEYKMEEHYDYGFFGARLMLDGLYKSILNCRFGGESIGHLYQSHFKSYIHEGVQEEVLADEMREFNLEKLAKAIQWDRDLLFNYLGMKTLLDRYLLKTRHKDEVQKKIFELPQWMWMRVAMGLACNEKNKDERAIEFYEVLSNMYMVSSTPTLFNSGTRFSQLSSCYINVVEDSLTGIFKSYSDEAQLSKWAGGIGTDWTGVRATGSVITGTNGVSSGIIPFIKIFNDIAIAVNQGGKRRGAMACYLENWHLDIEEFLELKKNTGDERRRAHDIHPAVFISDLFMKRVVADEKWTLFSPDDGRALHETYGKDFENAYLALEANPPVNHRVLRAKDLWRKMLTMLYETGHPWITYKDAVNVRSPQHHVGMVHSSNLCTEITLNTSPEETAVCNLGSINLAKMVSKGKLNQALIEKTITSSIRMLDNVIDINYYPTKEARNSNMRNRPIGLGMMGYHDALFQLGIPYSSDAQVDFADEAMEIISYYAFLASAKLAEEKGKYETYEGSKWSKGIFPLDTLDILEEHRGDKVEVNRAARLNWENVRKLVKKHGMRNSNCLAIAPTATISNIAGVVPCVEPIYKNIYMKENLSGNFFIINRYLIDRLTSLKLWNQRIIDEIKLSDGSIMHISEIPAAVKEEFREVFEIDQTWIIKAAAARSKWIDQSASTNLFVDTRSGKLISELYFLAWRMGMKTTYYLRTRAVSQITKTVGVDKNDVELAKHVAEAKVTSEAVTLRTLNEKKSVNACLLSDPDCEACQ